MIVASCVILLAACSRSCGERHEGAPAPVGSADLAALSGLRMFQHLVTPQNCQSLGFDSVEQAKRAVLAAPMLVFEIGWDRLKSFHPGDDVSRVLALTSSIIYPVAVDAQPRSGVTVVKKPEGYVPASFGNAETVCALAQIRTTNPVDVFAVFVPVLGMYFLAARTASGLMLTPALEYPDLPFRAGVAAPAALVVQALVPLVQRYNGLPI
ncbi:MAG TPA: hypothetical protein VHW23_45105 [Kofleriaceae bacterium]|jgi:hypothetical protein|nr:hypothetical protein [Kofleriaceae bacterium]